MGAGGGSTRGRGEMAATAAASAAAKSGDVVLAVGGADGADSGGRLAWRNVTYAVTSKKKDGERRVLLDNLSGSVERGELLAILGPSGAGKSSLLNALAGRVPTSNEYECELTGEISLGGRPCDAEDIVKVSAYVEQEDALFALSTCEETLLFAAALRLPQGTPTAELRARVDEVINELGLVKARHTPVGGNVPGAERGLSGGERKRLNIGIDLLHRPNLIFVDEPTSGLDSFQALNVMGTLIELSRHDRTVVCSVHQPRSSIYASLDKVLLLSQGRQVFLGGANDAADFFERVLGHALPPNYNPADFFLDTISMHYRSPGAQAQSEARLAGIFKVLDGLAAEGKEAVEAPVSAEGDDRAPEQTVLQGAFWTSFWLLLCRTWREQTRNKLALGIKLGMNIFFSIIFGLVYLRMPNSQQSIQDRTGLLFFSAMNAAFGAPIGVSQVIPRELKVVQRERASGMYSVISYYLAVFFASLPLELIPGLASASVMYFMAGLRPGAGYFAIYLGLQMLHYMVGCALGMVISASIPDVALAPQIAPAFIVLFLMFAGYLINEDSIPVYLIWLQYGSFIRYTFHALAVNEFRDASFECDTPADVPADGEAMGGLAVEDDGEGMARCMQGNDWLDFLSFEDVSIAENAAVLAGLLFGFHALAYCILVVRRPRYLVITPEDKSA